MNPRLHALPNGVRVVCDPTPELQTLALTVVAGRGARAETPSQAGWAHLLEHMVFKGAGARSARDIVEVIEAEGGSINAATGYERTSFQVRALKGGLDLGSAVISDAPAATDIADTSNVSGRVLVTRVTLYARGCSPINFGKTSPGLVKRSTPAWRLRSNSTSSPRFGGR